MGGTPGGRGVAEKWAEPHRGAASHPQKNSKGEETMPRRKPSRAAGLAAEVGMAKTSQARNKNRKKGGGHPHSPPPQSLQPIPGASGTGPRIPPCVPAPIPKTQQA